MIYLWFTEYTDFSRRVENVCYGFSTDFFFFFKELCILSNTKCVVVIFM